MRNTNEVWLFMPALDTCFWHTRPRMSLYFRLFCRKLNHKWKIWMFISQTFWRLTTYCQAIYSIKMTSHKRHCMPDCRQVKCLCNSLFQADVMGKLTWLLALNCLSNPSLWYSCQRSSGFIHISFGDSLSVVLLSGMWMYNDFSFMIYEAMSGSLVIQGIPPFIYCIHSS